MLDATIAAEILAVRIVRAVPDARVNDAL